MFPPFHFFFPNGCQPFLFLLHSFHLPHLFIFSITLLFSLYKNLPLLFLFFTFSDSLILSNSLVLLFSKLSSSSLMAPKAKKTSYVISFNAFRLTCWSGAMRLVGPPPLTYCLENHIPMAESVSFQTFSHFQVFLRSSVSMLFWPCK